MAIFYFFVWAGVWAWVLHCRGGWNLILGNLAGAASGFVVAMIVSVVCSALFPSLATKASEGLASSVFQIMTTAGMLAGVWMWMVNRRAPQTPWARRLLAGLCAIAAGIMTLIILVKIFH